MEYKYRIKVVSKNNYTKYYAQVKRKWYYFWSTMSGLEKYEYGMDFGRCVSVTEAKQCIERYKKQALNHSSKRISYINNPTTDPKDGGSSVTI